MKHKIANAIVNGNIGVEELKELTMDDLIKHAEVMEKNIIENRQQKIAFHKITDGKEREKQAEVLW